MSDTGAKATPLRWAIVPALPGTRIEWTAEWCPEGSVAVHAWLIALDIEPLAWVEGDGYDGSNRLDTSCAEGYPMIVNADSLLQDARFANLDGKPGEVFVT
jgi:hypothetical protein